MICPHCHTDMQPDKAGKPTDHPASRKAHKRVHYQRYLCTACFRYIKGDPIQTPPVPPT